MGWKNTLKFCHYYPSNNKFKKTLKRLPGTVKRKGKLLTSVLWKPFNSHYMAHIIKVPAFKINRCTIWSDRSTKVIYTGSSLMSAPFINVSGNKFYLNTDEFTSSSSKLPTFSATGKLRKSVYVFVLLFFLITNTRQSKVKDSSWPCFPGTKHYCCD